jgi:mercuric ion transport protein
LVANAYGWYRHRAHVRGALSVLGPLVALAALFPLWRYDWSINLFYVGLTFMLAVSAFDVFHPAKAVQCRT